MTALDSATDGMLAARAIDGDQSAFGILVRRHAPFLLAFATRLTGSRADADDCVQEALIVAWQRLPDLKDTTKVRSWLATIVSRKATDRLRSRRPVEPIEEDMVRGSDDPEASAVASSQLRALSHVLAELPEDLRVAWVLREISGHSYEEIAEITTAAPATVRGRIARARHAVLERMEEWR